jgi:hypothetical protein
MFLLSFASLLLVAMPRARHPRKHLIKCDSYLPVLFLWTYRQSDIVKLGRMADARIDAPNAHLGYTDSFVIHSNSSKSIECIRRSLQKVVALLQQATLCIDTRYACRPALEYFTKVIELRGACLLSVSQQEPRVYTYNIDVVGDVDAVHEAIRCLTAFGFTVSDARQCGLSKEPVGSPQ